MSKSDSRFEIKFISEEFYCNIFFTKNLLHNIISNFATFLKSTFQHSLYSNLNRKHFFIIFNNKFNLCKVFKLLSSVTIFISKLLNLIRKEPGKAHCIVVE